MRQRLCLITVKIVHCNHRYPCCFFIVTPTLCWCNLFKYKTTALGALIKNAIVSAYSHVAPVRFIQQLWELLSHVNHTQCSIKKSPCWIRPCSALWSRSSFEQIMLIYLSMEPGLSATWAFKRKRLWLGCWRKGWACWLFSQLEPWHHKGKNREMFTARHTVHLSI